MEITNEKILKSIENFYKWQEKNIFFSNFFSTSELFKKDYEGAKKETNKIILLNNIMSSISEEIGVYFKIFTLPVLELENISEYTIALSTYTYLTENKKYLIILEEDLRLPDTFEEFVEMILYFSQELEIIEEN